MIMYTNTSMVHMGIITHHSPLYEGNDQVVMAIQTFIIPLHSFNTSNTVVYPAFLSYINTCKVEGYALGYTPSFIYSYTNVCIFTDILSPYAFCSFTGGILLRAYIISD